ncbi:MAG TPA: aminotransferase class I/II-fold pyridoxal phosphate-dependent enzyme [Mycobacteriales bacterium]|nr:aminotransferase class I/II-fold pyridoxal phosphate-dependent enzyme [Mycobacteriales bacterium]
MTGEGTRAVHGPDPRPVLQQPVVPPLHRSTTFRFDSAQHTADVFAGRVAGWSYSRTENPTAAAFADAVAALEDTTGVATGQPFASGSAATATTLMALCSSGSHVVAPQEVYGGTWAVLTRQLARFGVQTTFVDATDPEAVRGAIRPETALVWGEVLANPSMAVTDLPAVAAVAREAGVPFVVDATFASPVICRPLEHGADLVVHSATKYLGGHSDATGGVVVGAPELVARVRAARLDLGGALAPDEAFLLLRGLQTLPLRVARQCVTALEVATALAAHPAVLRVDHPGLPTHRGHALAERLFDHGRFGAVITFAPHGGREAGLAVVDGLRLIARATSLGGTHSSAVHVATTTHKDMDAASLAAAGIDEGSVRLSVGLEDAADLLEDLTQALSRR